MTFWDQTVATRQAIMKGAQVASERQIEVAMFTAWQVARFTVYNGNKPLKPLGDYLTVLKPTVRRKQTSEEVIASMRAVMASMKG